MYEKFYHFKENPFNVTSDPVFFFSSNCHAQAFSHLTYGIEHRKGILLITGEVGTGKTTLCRTLLNKYRNHKEYNVKTALILNPSFSDQQLLKLILRDFGIQDSLENKFDLVNALNEFLLEETGKGNNIVLLIDEAQNLGVEQLEQIRLLSNLETEKQKLLQIILIGQPELCEKLELASLRQLNQRIAVRYHLLPLKREEIKKYIDHRLRIVSAKRSDSSVRFTNKAIDVVYESCKGTPRMINIICDRALLSGYTRETFIIDEKIINRCIKEVDIKVKVKPHVVQGPLKNIVDEKLIVGSTMKRKVWYKNIYIMIFVFFAIAGPLYTVLDFYGLISSPKQSDQNFADLPNTTGKSGLPEQTSVISSNISDESVLPVQKSVAPLGVIEKPDMSLQKNAVLQKVSDRSDLQTQKKKVPKRFRLLKPVNRSVETVSEIYIKGSSFYEQGGYKEAAVWFRKAAERGHTKAQNNLCVMYSEGHGVDKDYNEAVKWCRKAAGLGYAQAQTNLCIMYSEGKGVAQDYNEAAMWCRKAAEQGNGQAQAILGIMYSKGQGVEQDTEEAVKWFGKASVLGIDYATEALKRLGLDR
ncbi:MAG: AAA family ATPase [Candidatus Brocadiaceae bacterium]|nr:AAA family ATPase [Candidatus Brocadiaceae bacterium]